MGSARSAAQGSAAVDEGSSARSRQIGKNALVVIVLVGIAAVAA